MTLILNALIGIVAAIVISKITMKDDAAAKGAEFNISDLPLFVRFKNVFGWLVLYLIVINLTGLLQGVLGGLASVVGIEYYGLAKFVGATVVYIALVFFLMRKRSFLVTFKVLSVYYSIAMLTRIAALLITDGSTKLMNIYSGSSYLFLFAISYTVFLVSKREALNGSNG